MTSMFVDVCRLSESNLQPISSQIEALFRSYSRAELSETLARIVFDACVSWSRIPERLITEHVLLIAILHRNVGSEVGEIFRHILFCCVLYYNLQDVKLIIFSSFLCFGHFTRFHDTNLNNFFFACSHVKCPDCK